MMGSALGDIFAEVDTRLSELVAEGGYERMPTGDPDIFPAIVVYDDGDEPSETEAGATRLSLTISVQGYVEGASGAAAHDALNDLHADVVAALCTEPPLAGVETIEIVGRRRVDVAELASKRRLGFAQDFEIQYATPRGDPHQLA